MDQIGQMDKATMDQSSTSIANVEQLVAKFGDSVRTGADDLATYGTDWTKNFPVQPTAIVLPRTVEEVVELVRHARAQNIALVPSGGRTGLSGGAVATSGEVVVSLARMNNILGFEPADRTVRCEAGVVTQQLQEFAESKGLFYPVDFASSGSSQIGGNISTNAGGIRVIRYGMTRDWVAGLKVVTGAGEVLDLNRGLVKNNTGYDFRHLFVAAEGTLGLIVEADMRLARQPTDQNVLVLGVPQFADILQVLSAYEREMSLSAFEFFSDRALAKVIAHHRHAAPFDTPSAFYALLELDAADAEAALAVFEHCVEQGWVVDGVMSQSVRNAAELWRLREDISETLSNYTPYKNDLSVRIAQMPDFLADVTALVGTEYPDFEIVWFGHIGDGNLHLNILKPADLPVQTFFDQCHDVSHRVFDIVTRYGGSVSAEHGIGLLKRDHLGHSRSASELALMRQIKQVFDPDGIMNPGKLLSPL